jgi:release factor glutamine methyltransferase
MDVIGFKFLILMKIKNYKSSFIKELSSLYDEGEVESFFYIILENKHNLKHIDLALNLELEFSEGEIEIWNAIKEKLKLEIPIQYILGTTSFFGLEFEVNENVLIPRPETEELVELIIQSSKVKLRQTELVEVQKSKNLKILDIGTGSGCIAISLAINLPNSNVFAIDISEKALEIAQKNADINEVKVTFIKTDILQIEDLKNIEALNPKPSTNNQQPTTKFDIIVSNPPYVRNLEKYEIKKNVLDNEPHLALFVDDNDALIFYRKIAALAQKNLAPNGQLYFEINQYLGKETFDLLQKMNFKNIELKQDIYGNDRMICCKI